MSNMKTLQKLNLTFITFLMMIFLASSFSFDISAKSTQSQTTSLNSAGTNNCKVKQQEFRMLYLELQAKYLNYRKKDTTFDSKGNIVLVPHKEGTPYEGKEFEEAIFKEYLNSVSKVAKLFQDERFRPEISKQNKKLLDFIQSIDTDQEAYIKNNGNDIEKIVDMLYAESNKKYKSGADAKYALNERDKYLLKKLVTHAQDRICSVASYKRNKLDTMYFTADQLHQQMNAPLNRIMYAIKEANLTDKQRIVLYEPKELMVNGKEAVHSAIKEHINDIAKFVKANNACIARIKNLDFIQKNIQPCNYQHFMNSLKRGPGEFSEVESILHFINANDEFFGYKQKTAETDLDPEILEIRTRLRLADENGDPVLAELSCSLAKNDQGQEVVFLRNMPIKIGTTDEPDTSIIQCFSSKDNKPLDPKECQSKITVKADYLGRGLVVETKEDTDSGKIKFSIKDKPECSQVVNNNLTGPNPDITGPGSDAILDTDTGRQCPPGEVYDKEKLKCVPITAGFCIAEGLVLDPEKKPNQCMVDPNDNGKSCPLGQVYDSNQKKCVPITAGYCEAQGLVLDPQKQECKEPDTGINADICKQQGKILAEDGKSCVDEDKTQTPGTEDAPQTQDTPETPQNAITCKEDEKLEGTNCVKKDKTKTDDEAACLKKNEEWLQRVQKDPDIVSTKNRYKDRFVWKDNKCNDVLDESGPKRPKAAAAPIEKINFNDGPAPARFTPVQIPGRKFYVLPGMP